MIDFSPYNEPVTPISLGNLGAVLAASGHEVRILGIGSTTGASIAGLHDYLRTLSPDMVGFGTYQRNIPHVRALARLVKESVPGAAVVIGGPQATFLPESALEVMPEIDYISRGEGEMVIGAIAEAVDDGSRDAVVPGATSRSADGSIVTGENVTVPEDLDTYPSPWLTGLLDPAATEESIMLGSRGCPYACAFCYTPAAFGGKTRSHSVERVLDDISYVAERGTGRLWFADPNFSLDQDRVVRILEGVLRQNLDIEMWLETRADLLTGSLIALMKRAGVYCVAMGLESVSTEVVPKLEKMLDPEAVRQAASAALEAGLDVELFSQYALPGESLDDAMETLRFVKECGVKIRGNTNAQQMQIYFGSEISSTFGDHGIRPLRDEFPPYLSIGAEFETAWMSRDEIGRVRAAWLAESIDGGKRIIS